MQRGQDTVAPMVEQSGAWFSSLGVPRSTGRIFGYLIACDPAEQSAIDIARATGMSRASVSTGARMLVQLNAIEERHRVGDRKTYYRLRSGWWVQAVTARMAGFERLAEEARRTRARGDLTRTERLDELIAFAEFWAVEMPRLRQRWEHRHRERSQQV